MQHYNLQIISLSFFQIVFWFSSPNDFFLFLLTWDQVQIKVQILKMIFKLIDEFPQLT